MNQAMQGNAGHNVDKETSLVSPLRRVGPEMQGYSPDYFVHRMKNKRVAPHSDGYSVISHG
jgi:hypothetical protein